MNKKKYKTIENCRICNSSKLVPILNLGELYLSNFIDIQNQIKQIKAPLELVLCNGDCKLIQLRHTVSADEMFKEYWYLSGINDSMKTELRHIVKSIENLVKFKNDDHIIDIGANDGDWTRSVRKHALEAPDQICTRPPVVPVVVVLPEEIMTSPPVPVLPSPEEM